MSGAPYLKLTASIIGTEQRTTPHAGRDLDNDEADALLAFVERVGQPQIEQIADTQMEGHLMYEALNKLRLILRTARPAEATVDTFETISVVRQMIAADSRNGPIKAERVAYLDGWIDGLLDRELITRQVRTVLKAELDAQKGRSPCQ